MSGQGGRGHGGRGGCAGRGPGGSRGNIYTGGRVKTTKVGLCKDLESNVFNFESTSAVDQMQITQEKIAQYISAKHGEDSKQASEQDKDCLFCPSIPKHNNDLTSPLDCACYEPTGGNVDRTAVMPYLAGGGDRSCPRGPIPGHGASEA